MTHCAKQTFLFLEQQHQSKLPQRAGMKRISPQTTPRKTKQGSETTDQQLQQRQQQPQQQQPRSGLLASLIEQQLEPTQTSKPLLPLATQQTKCLTLPSDPVANGRDNVEGNLIVFEGDIITASNNLHTLQGSPIQRLRVLSLLGQGTFAQVFLCQCLDSGNHVALKVVKNKPAYTRQAAVEIDVFRALMDSTNNSSPKREHMVQLLCYFMHHSHLCLVFELLGLNLYEVLKRRQFRGLALTTVKALLGQAMEGIAHLSQKQIVHCDLKPENILIANADDTEASPPKIKLIDFGSACFEGHTSHTYIQSRFYRSPEVLVGLPYDSAIDMWSMGCVAAELFLGLPILPGVHEHDQLGRICEMIGDLPDWMMDQGSKANKYFVKQFKANARTPSPTNGSSPPPPRPTWRLKTKGEYIQSLSPSEIQKKGGMSKFEKQNTNRYFKRTKLADIVMLHGTPKEDREQVSLFVHFLLGILDPDPWKRWTAFQAAQHPFLTGAHPRRKSDDMDIIYWVPPWDPSICRRKLLNVQKTREKQQARRSYARPDEPEGLRRMESASPSMSGYVGWV